MRRSNDKRRCKAIRRVFVFFITVIVFSIPFHVFDLAFGLEPKVIAAFGDSLTAGFGVPADAAYPAQLNRRLLEAGYAFRVVNAGVSGETTAGGLRRVDWILQKIRPDIVILELGANDGLRGLDLRQMENNLTKMIERFHEKGVKVLLAGMKIPPNYGKAYSDAFEAVFPKLSDRHQIGLIPFFLDGVAAQPHLNQADGIHPTADGYKVLVDRIWPIVKHYIDANGLN
ncbi:MAG: arylesterase [Nitrospiria bacterium]